MSNSSISRYFVLPHPLLVVLTTPTILLMLIGWLRPEIFPFSVLNSLMLPLSIQEALQHYILTDRWFINALMTLLFSLHVIEVVATMYITSQLQMTFMCTLKWVFTVAYYGVLSFGPLVEFYHTQQTAMTKKKSKSGVSSRSGVVNDSRNDSAPARPFPRLRKTS